jgi:acetylglutamate kinase
MAEVVLMVLGGAVNRTLVAALQQARVDAVGLCGADGATFTASRVEKPGVDLGFVGAVDEVRPALVQALLAQRRVPVVATVATGRDFTAPFYNINADLAAGPLCRAFACEALLFLTDVPGVLDAGRRLLPQLMPGDCQQLVQGGVASGGMLPKLEAALLALRENPRALVKIAPAAGADAVRQALQPGTGTRFCAAQETVHG